MFFWQHTIWLSAIFPALQVLAVPHEFDSAPYASVAEHRTASGTNSSLVVDLGYALYEGWHNESAKLDVWEGIRFAQDTTGANRWQAPLVPKIDRSEVIKADNFPYECPQAPSASSSYTEIDNSENSEDCLFLSVFKPSNVADKKGLPVILWIHGGGYGQGGGGYDMTPLMYNNNNRFVSVSIQYRLGAFGFLSSDEVYRRGVANAGILDQQLALQWVQQYIAQFGGDPRRVTIFGESAGGGSVMLHDMAYGGELGEALFRQTISSSPYLPFQYSYKDWQPSQAYYALASAVGCDTSSAYLRNGSARIFDCLVAADYLTLADAATNVSQSGLSGTWAFLPVTDGYLIPDAPSQVLAREGAKVNGVNHLAGQNANEGATWVTQRIETVEDLVAYLTLLLPNFSEADVEATLEAYAYGDEPTDFDAPTWATWGDEGPTHIHQSTAATGQQQRAMAVYGELTFTCPSYWLAEAYSNSRREAAGRAWKYQFSIPNAYHGADGSAYFRWPETGGYYSADFIHAFMVMLGNFVVDEDPSIPSGVANGVSTNSSVYNPLSEWPVYDLEETVMANFNTTCPEINYINGLPYCDGEGQRNTFRLVDGYAWEGGRGERCDFWRKMGEKAPV